MLPQIGFLVSWPSGDLLVVSINRAVVSLDDAARLLSALHEVYPMRMIGIAYLGDVPTLEER